MRIAVLSNAYPPEMRGGAGRIAETYTKALEARGHEMRVWRAGEGFARLSAMNALSRLFFHIIDLGARRDTVEAVRAWKPDILLTHNLTGCGFGTPRATGLPWFHVLHDVQIFEPSGRIMHGEGFGPVRSVWRRLWSAMRGQAMGRPKGIISPTRWLLDLHRSFSLFIKVPHAIIPNPVDIAIPSSSERDTSSLLFVGRLDTDKGAGLLFVAWPRLRDKASKLVLIGDGEWRSRFDALKDPKIEVLGTRSPEEVMRRMSQAGIVLVPSLVAENQPTVILEALSSGCHVIASDIGGIKETLGPCGTLIAPDDVEALARACMDTLGTSPSANEMECRHALLADHLPDLAASRVEAFARSNL